MLFGCYRRGDANDPEMYVSAVAAVLACYDVDLIREVTDPRTGIMTTEKHMTFMPNAGELKVYCDGVAGRKERINRLAALPSPHQQRRLPAPPARAGDLATVWVSASHPKYQRFLDWSKTADDRLWRLEPGKHGIWIAYDIATEPHLTAPKAASYVRPGPLALSEETLKAMRDIDAERNHQLPIDQHEEDYT